MKPWIVCLALFVGGAGGAATMQAQESADQPDETPKPKSKKKPPKKLKHKKTNEPEAAAEPEPEPEPKAPPSPFFPDWGRKGFHWTIGPILAYRYGSFTNDAGTTRSTTLEGGLHPGVYDVPVAPGNPGLGINASALEAYGLVSNLDTKGADVTAKFVRYKRTLGELGTTFYYHFLREELDLTRGRIEYDDPAKTLVQSLRVRLDNGVLVLGWLSTHYTIEYLKAFADQFDSPLLTQTDHWLHARIDPGFLSFYLDLGPGTTFVTVYGPPKDDGQTEYWKALTGMHLFWKLGMDGEAKYVVDSSTDQTGGLAGTRLPEEELGTPSSVAQPADSVQAALFFGIHDLIHGVGMGYRYDLQILNLGRHGGRPRETTKDSGVALTYSASL